MATRPIFIPNPCEFPYVKTVDIEFQWYPGFASSQVPKTVTTLHEAAAARRQNRGGGMQEELSRSTSAARIFQPNPKQHSTIGYISLHCGRKARD